MISSCFCTAPHRRVLPFDKTKRSLLKYVGLLGEYFMTYFQSEIPMAAIPMAPLLIVSEENSGGVVSSLPRVAAFELFA